MRDYFSPAMSENDIKAMSNLGLAHIGDAVFELLVRTWLCTSGKHTARGLHSTTVRYVCAGAQSRAMTRLLPLLSETEQAVFRRGKNAKVNSVPKNADISEYHHATGLEALFGYLYLNGETARINELFTAVVEE